MPQRLLVSVLCLGLAAPSRAGGPTARANGTAASPYTGVFDPSAITREWQGALGSFASWAATSSDPNIRVWGGLQDLLSPANGNPAALAAVAPLLHGLRAAPGAGNGDLEDLRLAIGEAYRAVPAEKERVLGLMRDAAARGALTAAVELRSMVDQSGQSPERAAAALQLARQLGDMPFYGGEPRRAMLADLRRIASAARGLHMKLGQTDPALAAALGEAPAVAAVAPTASHMAGLQRPAGLDPGIVAEDPAMREIFGTVIPQFAQSKATVLILGETGVGKEVAARELHKQSPLKDGPFFGENVTAIPEQLVESALFGHKKGAFTSAIADKTGFFDLVSGVNGPPGTLFLDEIGDLKPELQVKLLRVLQTREYMPIGDTKARPFKGRIVVATHRDLKDMVAKGTFRQDLYYRLNVLDVRLPPLRERSDDIPALAELFLRKLAAANEGSEKRLSAEALQALRAHSWPGNVRELENAMERGYALARDGVIRLADLPLDVRMAASQAPSRAPAASGPEFPGLLTLTIEQVERLHIETMLRYHGWNIPKAAAALGIAPKTLYNKIKAYEIVKPGA